MDYETLELEITESHKNRYDELTESMPVDVEQELAGIVMQSIDETYRQQLNNEQDNGV